MMSLIEISTSAAALGNQIGAGIPLDQALRRLVLLQPRYATFWEKSAQNVKNGIPFSNDLPEIWPQSLVSAVTAGEQSGSMSEVLTRIEETLEIQLSLQATLMKLSYPIGMGLAGLGVFLGFMIFVLPMLAKSLASGGNSIIFQFSNWLSTFVLTNYLYLGLGIGFGIFTLIAWIKTPNARESILTFCLKLPVIKTALRDMYFGLWTHYMAMMVKAGIPTTQALTLTATVLPGDIRTSILAFENDLTVNNKSLESSADITKLPENDLRSIWWPFYISNAFIVAEQTGEIDKELLRVAPALIKEGIKGINKVVDVLNIFALGIAATLIVSPLAAYYSEIFSSIRTAGR